MNASWVGESSVFNVKGPVATPDIVFPLVEETVLSVAFDTPGRHISKRCAINCTSRLAQRWALARTGLNPMWFPYPWAPDWVIKAPASCLNNGVAFTRTTEHVDLLRSHAPFCGSVGVIEKKLQGDAFEVDGLRVAGTIFRFPVLSQTWDAESTRILEYRKVPTPSGLVEAVETCLDAVGLDDGCFCIEFRRTPEWKVIEVHARLGEDDRLRAAWGFDPTQMVEYLLRELYD